MRNFHPSKKQLILAEIEELVVKFLYYDRQKDPSLKLYDIEFELYMGNISIDEIAEKFGIELRKNIERYQDAQNK